jgi:hypothetical protein
MTAAITLVTPGKQGLLSESIAALEVAGAREPALPKVTFRQDYPNKEGKCTAQWMRWLYNEVGAFQE